MKKKNKRELGRIRRRLRIRRQIMGRSDCPRLALFKSVRHLYVQIVDDVKGHTLVSASTMDKALREKIRANLAGAKIIGQTLAKRAQQKGITQVVFDRSGYRYHGCLKALADGAREGGLKF